MDRMNGSKVSGAAVMLALGLSVLGVVMGASTAGADDAAPSKAAPATPATPKAVEAASDGKRVEQLLGPVYGLWAKGLGLDQATRAKLAEIFKAQEAATKANVDTLEQLRKGMKSDVASDRPSDAKAKQAERVRLRGEVAITNTEYYVKAMALLTPEQQKKAIALLAVKDSVLGRVTLTAEQEKKVMEKLEASAQGLVDAQNEIDYRKLRPIVTALAEEVLTAEQKKSLTQTKEERKAKHEGEGSKGADATATGAGG